MSTLPLLLTVNWAGAQFAYDANGNLSKDASKGIDTIEYTESNLVSLVKKAGDVISYVYDATGIRLSKSVAGSSGVHIYYYVDGIEYEGEGRRLNFLSTEEGRITSQQNRFNYEYILKDHLGNTRVSFEKNLSTGFAKIIQTNNYYPFGASQREGDFTSGEPNKYLYNGKEWQEETGFYDYGARMYDPVLARWNNADPQSEMFFEWSAYNYALNNPLKFEDKDGALPTLATAAIGGVVGGLIGGGIKLGMEAWEKSGTDKEIDWKAVGGEASRGAVVGFCTGLAGPVGYKVSAGVVAIANGAGGVLSNTIQGKEITMKGVLVDLGSGALGGAAGVAIGRGVNTLVNGFVSTGTETAAASQAATNATDDLAEIAIESAASQSATPAASAASAAGQQLAPIAQITNAEIRTWSSDRLAHSAQLLGRLRQNLSTEAYAEAERRVLAELGRRFPRIQWNNVLRGQQLTPQQIQNIKIPTQNLPDVPGIPDYSGLRGIANKVFNN